GLMASLPRLTKGTETRLFTIEGVAPPLTERPHACVFAPRCLLAIDICRQEKPPPEAVDRGERTVRCHRWREIYNGELALDIMPAGQVTSAPPRRSRILNAQHIHKRFGESSLLDMLLRRQPQYVHAVDDASVRIQERSTLGLVGESGSGKTTLARCIVALEEADSGSIELCEMQISNKLEGRSKETLRNLRMIFQNPNDALNPYQSVRQALERPLRLLSEPKLTNAEIRERVNELLQAVRLTPDYAERYPHELSGGEKQRVAIARAFAANPVLIVADEPTSSLDVSVQAVILNLLKDLRAEKGVSYMLISHDLDVVAYLADWIAVMYLGEIVEEGETTAVYEPPWHPYTEALLSAVPVPDPTRRQGATRLEGEMPSARHIPPGCRFHTRCPRKLGPICEQEAPPWRDAGNGHRIRCHIEIDDLITMQAAPPEPREVTD
ncbi:MAG TPA: oligopeptide/dipeptide ABC transporter ATP-binding protein, partial [Spirillospora sp.]|nr:oligopeptide/dipeptide ABC transporter ATP-binding protein [Spirillospora sp.]